MIQDVYFEELDGGIAYTHDSAGVSSTAEAGDRFGHSLDSVRGYDATLVSDAHTTEDLTAWGAPPPDQVIAHTNLYWSNQSAPGRTAGTVATEHVDFADTA